MPAALRSTASLQHWELPPAAAQTAGKKQELPALKLLPPITAAASASTASSALPTSSASSSRSAFLTHAAAYCGQPKSAAQSSSRPSSSPPSLSATAPLPAGLCHPQRLPSAASSAPSTSKPRWFTNRLALSLPSADDRIDFSRYSSHASSYAPQRKRWTRDAMIAEILAEKQRQRDRLRRERARLDRELHRVRSAPPVSADSREQLLSFLQSKGCLLFQGSDSAISVRDRDLDQLIASGGEEERCGSGGRRCRGFLLYLQQLNDAGLRCGSFQVLISYVKKARAEAEGLQSTAETDEQQDVGTQQQGEAADTKPVGEPADASAAPAPTPEPASAAAAPQLEKEEAAVSQQSAQPEPQRDAEAAAEDEEKRRKDAAAPPSSLPPASAAEDASSLLVDLAVPSSGRMRMDSIVDRADAGAHQRHNTVAAAGEAAELAGRTAEAALSVGSLMQKLAELEEEQEKDEEHSEQPTAQQDAEFGNTEEDAQPL